MRTRLRAGVDEEASESVLGRASALIASAAGVTRPALEVGLDDVRPLTEP